MGVPEGEGVKRGIYWFDWLDNRVFLMPLSVI